MIFKLDMSKAYDHISWDYLVQVPGTEFLGFDPSYLPLFSSILINGSPSIIFTLACVLHQSDPMSPFLFILAMEGLGCFSTISCSQGKIKGL